MQEKPIGKRTALMVLGALPFTLPLHGQQPWTPDLRKDENRLNLAMLVKLLIATKS